MSSELKVLSSKLKWTPCGREVLRRRRLNQPPKNVFFLLLTRNSQNFSFPSLVRRFLSLVVTFLSSVRRIFSLVVTFLSSVRRIFSLVVTSLSSVRRIFSLVVTFFSLVRRFVSLVVTFMSLVRRFVLWFAIMAWV